MRRLTLLCATAAALALVPAASTAVQGPAAGPQDEPRTRWRFSESTRLDCTFMRVSADGDAREYRPFDATVEQSARRSWVDAGATANELPFVRIYDDVSHRLTTMNKQSGRPDGGQAMSTSEVVGKPIRFVPPAEANAGNSLRAELVDLRGARETGPDGDAAEEPEPPGWLSALDPTTGFPGLKPSGGWEAVEPGGTWKIPAAAFASILRPGGDLPSYFGALKGARDPDDIARYGALAACRQTGPIMGGAEAKLDSVKTEGGERLARVLLTYELQVESDPTAWMREQSRPFEMAQIGQSASNAKITTRLKGTGVVVWDLDADRAVEITLRADTTIAESLDYSFTFRNISMAGDYLIEFAGTTDIELVVIE